MADFELLTCTALTMAEVFDCKTGRTMARRMFTGWFHKVRARAWAMRLCDAHATLAATYVSSWGL